MNTSETSTPLWRQLIPWYTGVAAVLVFATWAYLAHAQQPDHTNAATANPSTSQMNTPAQPGSSPAKYSPDELRKKLTAEQYRVTCEAGTEPPFRNAYWNNHRDGIYVDVISGKALFSSKDKFESGTGWPSFTKPLVKENVVVQSDNSLGMERDEVKAKDSNAHLGHVFDDGPTEAGGMRYCMNSASLRFIPVEKLKEEGYGEYLPLFEKKDGDKKYRLSDPAAATSSRAGLKAGAAFSSTPCRGCEAG